MEIRLARESDIPQLLKLLYQVGGVHHRIRPDIFRPGAVKYTQDDLAALLADPSRPVFAALEGERMLGYCFCVLKENKGSTVQTDRRELYIDDLCVDEGRRGSGVGRALFAWVKNYGKQAGCDFLTLNVWQGNDSAMAFYRRAGLTPRSVTMEMTLED